VFAARLIAAQPVEHGDAPELAPATSAGDGEVTVLLSP
jgi:hypothetical protein